MDNRSLVMYDPPMNRELEFVDDWPLVPTSTWPLESVNRPFVNQPTWQTNALPAPPRRTRMLPAPPTARAVYPVSSVPARTRALPAGAAELCYGGGLSAHQWPVQQYPAPRYSAPSALNWKGAWADANEPYPVVKKGGRASKSASTMTKSVGTGRVSKKPPTARSNVSTKKAALMKEQAMMTMSKSSNDGIAFSQNFSYMGDWGRNGLMSHNLSMSQSMNHSATLNTNKTGNQKQATSKKTTSSKKPASKTATATKKASTSTSTKTTTTKTTKTIKTTTKTTNKKATTTTKK